MNERPILFSAPMVRALLAGTKTQTRRVVAFTDDLPAEAIAGLPFISADKRVAVTFSWPVDKFTSGGTFRECPYGAPGDRLWVREAWQYYDWTEDGQPCIRFAADNATEWREDYPEDWVERLQDIWAVLSSAENFAADQRARDRRWRPSIHMPRWASRILLEVTEVRVQRLQDISEADCRAEGIDREHCEFAPRAAYHQLWESINGADSWAANPWVWAVSFKPVQNMGAA